MMHGQTQIKFTDNTYNLKALWG